MTKQWVELAQPFNYFGDHVMPAGSVGYIREVNSGIEVAFPQSHTSVPISILKPAKLLTVEEAIKIIQAHMGHHCRNGRDLQFNIRFNHFDAPEIIEKHWLRSGYEWDQKYWDAYDEIIENELKGYIGEDYEGGLSKLVPWFEDWRQAGRSGGWLIIKCDYNFVEIIDEDIPTYRDEGHLKDLEYAEDKIIDLAMWIQYIEADIKVAQAGLQNWIKQEECWETQIEEINARLIEDEGDEDEEAA
ncbi:hypothetical protein ACK8P5_26135 (plasmid) [Paenibacillus sp. EC2-1]|uniref:hypothetical protein n=1 Tax=Paenibacillus sp. EC2-1 TaxID=3388665 RepID=UPI003BEEF994